MEIENLNTIEITKDSGFITSSICSCCGSGMLIKAGTCSVCFNCGETSGCS